MFITLEGVEGSGKSTVCDRLATWLKAQGFDLVLTREPGSSSLGRKLRAILLDMNSVDLSEQSELFLYLADRAQHVREVLEPALGAGKIVLCDRYADSTLAYQGYGRGVNLDELTLVNNMAIRGLWPDLTLLFDVDAEVGLSRARKRNQEENIEQTEGRFEAEELDFHQRIRQGYLNLAQKYAYRYRLIDANLPANQVFEQAQAHLALALGIKV